MGRLSRAAATSECAVTELIGVVLPAPHRTSCRSGARADREGPRHDHTLEEAMDVRLNRRRLVLGMAGIAGIGSVPMSLRAAMGPNDKFDLLIKGGDVLDPSQSLRGVRDIGIRNGVIEAVQADIAADRALRVITASGRLVTPGLIDLHAHTFPYGSGIGIPADELVPFQGTTTAVSAGDAGANNFAAFRRFIVSSTRTRLYAFVHIANMGLAGFPVGELYNIDFAQPDAAARTVAENADIVLGIKVRMSENVIAQHGLEPLRRAIRACEMSGTSAKIMCHIGGVETPALMTQILDTLRPRDILTHCYSGAPNIAGRFTNIVQDGRLLPAALDAKRRGVNFDIGHGGGSFDYTVAEAAIAQGAGPDTISSDMHVFSGNTPGMPFLTWVMSKFLAMGFTLEQVISMATVNPARVIDRVPKLGTLQVGAPGDVTVIEQVEGPVEFVDTRNNKRAGKVFLRPVQTVNSGIVFGRPFSAPFSVR
jgi:dihydroorotase